jgi:DNA replication protein DnaC
VHCRNDRKRVRLLKAAHLKYPQAAIEDIDARPSRGIERRTVMSLALGDWVASGQSILITGPTGAGKSWLACALAQHACRRGYSAVYQRVPRLEEELRGRHASGMFGRWLMQIAKTDVLLLDDWGMGCLDGKTRSDLLEVIDDRAAVRATIITSQLPIEHWHAWIGDATVADAMLDRLMQRHHRLTLSGDSLRQSRPAKGQDDSGRDVTP